LCLDGVSGSQVLYKIENITDEVPITILVDITQWFHYGWIGSEEIPNT